MTADLNWSPDPTDIEFEKWRRGMLNRPPQANPTRDELERRERAYRQWVEIMKQREEVSRRALPSVPFKPWPNDDATVVAPSPTMETAFVAGPIVAWRVWRVQPGGVLVSLHRGDVWPAGRPLTVKVVPQYGQGGVYAMKQREGLDMNEVSGDVVAGTVALWGKVIEHEKGYRAQYAYPLVIELADPAPMPGFPRPTACVRLADKIRERYGCEVRG